MITFQEDRMFDLICLGRAGIDLNTTELNKPLEDTVFFRKTVGGSPANIAVGAAALGLKTGFIGRVAKNGFGRYIEQYFKSKGIDTSCLIQDPDGGVNGLAITEIKSPTDCGSVMYRDKVADLNLAPHDIKEDYIASSKILLVSGTALSAEPSRAAAFLAVDYARRNGTVVVLDIDYRPFSWRSEEETVVYLSLFCEKCDIIIGNREEFDLVEQFGQKENNVEEVGREKDSEHSWTGKSTSKPEADQKTANNWLSANAELVIIKRGAEGATCFVKGGVKEFMGVYPTEMKKTFGAGDAFAAALLYCLVAKKTVLNGLRYGAAAASLVVGRMDCSESMPTLHEIEEKINKFGSDYVGVKTNELRIAGDVGEK